MCPSASRVCSEPGGQKPVLSLSLDLIVINPLSPKGTIIVAAFDMNSLAPEWCGSNFISALSKSMLQIKFMSTACEIALRWMPHGTLEDKSTLVQVGAGYRQATSHHYLNQCWPRSMAPYGAPIPQWVNPLRAKFFRRNKNIYLHFM